ncbi:DNA cytosine methyltransferase [Pectobacterium polonicum]|uniref:Cytosine-specific methyltransferase n=1 Tax=Pectobacterium polonicum TaxID=2485124 RepID=A0ABV1PA78_9GAMM|nr:DNA cytosine methyltransferase [Pectobacterium polonicum]MDC9818698.1 DNA cytosine methyltransferase [Pectobacterium polonicum]
MKKDLKIIDLFCGCGGFGLGAEMAGFHTHIAVDIDETLQSSYKVNFPSSIVLQADLAAVDSSFWASHIGDIAIDGVIGGPPCQGYSRMGISDKMDPRRSLLTDFFRNVNLIRPKFFIMENVEGLLDKKNIYELNNAISILNTNYIVTEPFIIDASSIGAPTKRKRVLLIGYLPEYFHYIDIKKLKEISLEKVSVKDAISDLSSPITQSFDKTDLGWGKYNRKKKISEFARKMRKAPPHHLGSIVAKRKLLTGKVSGFFDTLHTEEVILRYATLKPGDTDKISRAKKLDWAGLCPTLRAGTGADKGSFQAVRPIHPDVPRVITVREAARLQGFPDWFTFHATKWHSFRMIGNSVSPIVSEFVLNYVKEHLKISELRKVV